MVNGRTFLTLNGNVLVRPPSLEATPNKGDNIKRNVMIGDYSAERGLKMIDLESFNKAPGSKNTLTQKIMVNGSTFFALNCNFLVGLPSLEAASNRT